MCARTRRATQNPRFPNGFRFEEVSEEDYGGRAGRLGGWWTGREVVAGVWDRLTLVRTVARASSPANLSGATAISVIQSWSLYTICRLCFTDRRFVRCKIGFGLAPSPIEQPLPASLGGPCWPATTTRCGAQHGPRQSPPTSAQCRHYAASHPRPLPATPSRTLARTEPDAHREWPSAARPQRLPSIHPPTHLRRPRCVHHDADDASSHHDRDHPPPPPPPRPVHPSRLGGKNAVDRCVSHGHSNQFDQIESSGTHALQAPRKFAGE